jgi:DNA-binding transcriptional MerR regulator
MGTLARREFYSESQRVSDARPEPQPGDASGMTIGELAREAGVTLRALRFYQSRGLLAPGRNGQVRIYSQADRERLTIVLQGKRLGFTLSEIREMVVAQARGCDPALPISRKKCVEQIKLLERQRREVELALTELRQIYTGMYKAVLPLAGEAAGKAF